MKKKQVKKLIAALEKAVDTMIAKCGGPGGTPGPCPSGRKPEGRGDRAKPKTFPENMKKDDIKKLFEEKKLPHVVQHEGARLTPSGKYGQRNDGKNTPAREMMSDDDKVRAWQDINGNVYSD